MSFPGLSVRREIEWLRPPCLPKNQQTTETMIRKILIVLASVIGVLVIIVAMRPADFRISRKAVIPAPPAAVFPHVNDLHLWQNWSPWAKLDPKCWIGFRGPESGKGAFFRWSGNNEVGEGSMEIIESIPNEKVVFDLIFVKPMAGKSLTEFTFKPEGSGTEVIWTMSGKNDFMGKLFSLFVDCDKMVGSQFEKGFENLKAVVARPAMPNN